MERNLVFEKELVAVALDVTMALFAPVPHNVLRCGNQGEIGTNIRDTCKTPSARSISGFIWCIAPDRSAHLWDEFANSDNNTGDAPSRRCGDTMELMLVCRVLGFS